MTGNRASRLIRSALRRLRSWWDYIRRDRGRFGLVTGLWLALVYFVLAGLVPAAYVKKDYLDGATFVGLYSHVFRYPQFFGWITILLLIRPVLYLTSLPGLDRTADRLVMLIILVTFSALILMINIQSRNITPFEVDAGKFQTDERLKDHFKKAGDLTLEERVVYQDRMLKLLEDRKNWSTARYWYHVSIFIQIFNVLFIFVVTFALTIHGLAPNSDHSHEFREALVYCSLAILVSYLWLLMRVAFNRQKTIYFPSISNPTAELMIVILFALATLLVAIRLLSWLPDKFSAIFSFASAIAAILGTLSAARFQDALVEAFGRDSGTAPYWTILLVIGAVLLIILVLSRKVGPFKGADSSGPAP